jgi:flagellar hook protein FlgE
MDLSAIALQGLGQAEVQLEAAATALASAGTLSPDAASADAVDLSTEILALLSAKNEFSANLTTLKLADEIQKNTINLLA